MDNVPVSDDAMFVGWSRHFEKIILGVQDVMLA